MVLTNMVCLAIVAFLFGVATTMLATPRKKKDESIGTLVVDMTEPYDPGLYLSIESDDEIFKIVDKHSDTVTLKVNVYGE